PQAPRRRRKRLVPAGLPKAPIVSDQRKREAIDAVDEVPPELAFDARRDAIGRRFRIGLDLQNFALRGPYVEGTTDATIRADGLRFLDRRLAHLCLGIRGHEQRREAGELLQVLHELGRSFAHWLR